jgi:hypothetical protein
MISNGNKLLMCVIVVGFVVIAGCTNCSGNECKKLITPISNNNLQVIDDNGGVYYLKDIYVSNKVKVNSSCLVTYIDDDPKLVFDVICT